MKIKDIQVLKEGTLSIDVPNEDWLADKIDYAKSKGRNSFGVPYMGSTTAYVRQPGYVELPVDLLARLPGARGEQSNVRYDDLAAIMKIMKDTGKLPLTQSGKEYMPFITVAWNGEPWVMEGNHRIMAAKRLGWKTLPVELKYFDGGERIRSGVLYPGKIGLGEVKNSHETDEDPLVVVYDKDGELHTHANLSVANNIFRTNVKPDDVFKGPVKVKSGGSYGEVTFALSKHHKTGPSTPEKIGLDTQAESVEQVAESQEPGEYVYHASYLPDQLSGLKSVMMYGLKPSRDGYAGPGVYFAYDPEGGFYHVDKEDATMFRARWADLAAKFGTYPNNENGIQRDDNEIIVPGRVPPNMLEVEYFPGEWWDLASAYHASKGPSDVTEAFDRPYKLRWEQSDYGDVDAYAKMDDGNYLSIMFNKGVSQGTGEEAWSVEFWRNNSQEVTGEGDAQRVFATVLGAIQTFIKKYKPNRVIFSATKEVEPGQNAQSRARLYDSLVQRYARAWGFRAFRADTGDKVIYELNRIKPIVAKPVEETINTDILNRRFKHTQTIGDYTYKASVEIFLDEPLLNIKAYDGAKEIGHAMFEIFHWDDAPAKSHIESGGTEVEPAYRNKGVASTMYAYAKMLGNDVRPSNMQSAQGHTMWAAWKHSGDAKHLTGNGMAEARTNPEQNQKPASGFKELAAVAKTIADPENWAISMTSEPKLGINPQVGISEDTPKGIYFYPLNYALSKTRYGKLPWGNDYPYIQLFQFDRSREMTKDTQVDPNKLKQALSQYCSEEVIQSAIDEPEYDGTPYWFIYDCLSRLGKSDETNVVRWNKVLRDLGFTSVYDDGAGWIAYNEPTQGVVLDPRVIKQLKTIVNKKQSGVITPAIIEQAIFETMDMELASNRAWQAYDPDGSKLKAAAKEFAKDSKFKQYYGKPGTEEIFDKVEGWGRYGARQLSDIAYEWWQEQKSQKTESVIVEGGWASTETQNTVITPKTVAEIIHILDGFEASYNAWQAGNELDTEIKIGKPKGSGTYYRRDLEQDPNREYGDVDVECFIHSRKGMTSAQRITEYKMAITDYCLQSPDFSTENGTNIIMRTTDGPVQVDLIFTYHEHADWSRVLSPEYRVKGVISTSLTSSIAEALNLSFSSQGIQVKIRNNQPVSFRQSKDTELRTVSTSPETWAQDIYSLYYYLSHGEQPTSMPRELQAHGGLKDEQRLSDIVLSIKALASGLEESNLLGHGSLIDIHDKKDLIRRVAQIYSNKLEAAENSSKFDKASTPIAIEKAKKTKLMLAKYRNEVTKLLLN